jgi:hypothetical protein
MEMGSNTSTVALWVVGGEKREPSTWGYNWAPLYWGDINTGSWLSRLVESRIWGSKIWSWVPWDLDSRMTALARASSNCKWQTCSLIREGAPHQQTRNCLTVIRIWSWAPDGGLTPRQTDRLTICHNITLTWFEISHLWVRDWSQWLALLGCTVNSHYLARTNRRLLWVL